MTAAVKGAELHGYLPSLISLIKPAADKAKTSGPEEEAVPRAIELNVWQQVEKHLRPQRAHPRSPPMAKCRSSVRSMISPPAGIKWLGQHPEMDRLLTEAKSQSPQPRVSRRKRPAPPRPHLRPHQLLSRRRLNRP